MEPGGGFPIPLRLLADRKDLFQCHLGTVVYLAVLLAQPQQYRIHQTARIDHHIRLSEQLCPPQGDKIRRTGPCSYKVYHGCSSISRLHAH